MEQTEHNEKGAELKRELRQFGFGMAAAMAVISLVSFFTGRIERHQVLVIISVSVFSAALIYPYILYPFHFVIQNVIKGVFWLSTNILLSLVFYLVFSPVGIFLRITGKDWMDKKIEPDRESYWQIREKKEFDPTRVEKQF